MKITEIEKARSIIKCGTRDAKYLLYNILINKSDTDSIVILNEIPLFDKVRTYADVCKLLRIKELTTNDFSFLPKDQQLKTLNFHKIKNIEKLFNENWIIDWKNRNQRKYFPYFEERGSGLVFSVSLCSDYYSYGTVGYFKDEETSDFVGETFTEIFINI